MAYTGIQNRANDTAVQTDLRGLAGKVLEFQALEGRLPEGRKTPTNSLGGDGPIEGIPRFPVTRQAYSSSVAYNFYYCKGTVSGEERLSIIGMSASGHLFRYNSSVGAPEAISGTWSGTDGSAVMCPLAGIPSNFSLSYGKLSSGWLSWTQ